MRLVVLALAASLVACGSSTPAGGGGGTSCVIEDGNIFERGGVNLSFVTGSQLPPSATAARPHFAGRPWEAMGVSLVLPFARTSWFTRAQCTEYLR